MSDHTPYIDFENLPTPDEGFLVTHFITPPIDRGAEIRCYMRDPRLAKKRAEDLPG